MKLYEQVATFEEPGYEQPAWRRYLAEQAETLSLFDESGGVVSDEDWAEHLAPTDMNIRGVKL